MTGHDAKTRTRRTRQHVDKSADAKYVPHQSAAVIDRHALPVSISVHTDYAPSSVTGLGHRGHAAPAPIKVPIRTPKARRTTWVTAYPGGGHLVPGGMERP